jgi:hypothetical protein
VKGNSYCPTDWFDKLPPDTEQEDDPSIPASEIITQTEELADEEHLLSFGIRAESFGFNAEETEEVAEERNREARHCAHFVWGNSSTSVTEDEDIQGGTNTVIMTSEMSVVDDSTEPLEQQEESE